MRQWLILFAVLVITGVPAISQNTSSDSQTLRDILTEVREMRHDLQKTTVAGQRVQIALYRLQVQDAAVARASKIAEDAHLKLHQTSSDRKQIALFIEHEQSLMESGGPVDNKRKEQVAAFKAELEQLTKQEPELQAQANDADAQLAREQSKLESLRTLLDELDVTLQNTGGGTDSKLRH